MSDNLTALASENLNPGLKGLLEDVQRGHIRVPRFQRPFIWTDDQRLELLRSIRDGMPIGSLLVWRTSQFKLASFPTIGPHIIPAIAETAPTIGWQYVLDGHQRISSLLALLFKAGQQLEDDGKDWDIQFDLQEREFVFAARGLPRRAKRPLLPLWTLLDGRLVNKQMREIRKQCADTTESELDEWEKRADQLSYSFQQYRIPVVVMVTNDLGLATTTFQRINSQGTPMSEEHLVTALTWSEQFDLREQLDQLLETLPLPWRGLDEKIFLQVCKGLSGLDMSKAGQTALVDKLKKDKNYKLLTQAGEGIRRAIELLTDRTCMVSHEWLPYTFQLVLLAVELADRERTESSDYTQIRWFWRTCWSEVFSSASYRQIKSEQDALKESREPEWFRERELPKNFDFRAARTRLFMLRLAMRQQYSTGGNMIDGRALLARHGRDALVRLFPPPRPVSDGLKQLLQGIGNSFFIAPEGKSLLRDRLQGTDFWSTEEMKIHFVDSYALSALRSGDMETFVQKRAEAMVQFDSEEMNRESQHHTES